MGKESWLLLSVGSNSAPIPNAKIIKTVKNTKNTNTLRPGFTYSNGIVFRAVVCIGPTSSGAEFQNTLVHEIHHLAVAIASGIGVDLESETPAYLAGDTMREFADVVCHLGCDHCRG